MHKKQRLIIAVAVAAAIAVCAVVAAQDALPPGHTAADVQNEESAAEYLKRIDAENAAERNAQCRQDGQTDTVSIQLNIEFDCYAIEGTK
jgi:uncharacterized protein involved in high-affinity Fe2+ transport